MFAVCGVGYWGGNKAKERNREDVFAEIVGRHFEKHVLKRNLILFVVVYAIYL